MSTQRVFHPKLGYAQVAAVELAADGSLMAVADFGYTKRRLAASEFLEAPGGAAVPRAVWERLAPNVTAGAPAPAAPAPPPATPPTVSLPTPPAPPSSPPGLVRRVPVPAPRLISTATQRARQGVLALRLGQILEHDVLSLSVGTERLRSAFERIVADAVRGKPAVALIEGPWGGGKTHSLTLAQAIAQGAGFATANVVLDGRGATLSEPRELMPQIVTAIRYPGRPSPEGVESRVCQLIRDRRVGDLERRGGGVLAEALSRIPTAAADDPDILAQIELYLLGQINANTLNTWLKGQGYTTGRLTLPAIRARKRDEYADNFAELLRNWAHFAATTGAAGLMVVLDELDVEYAFAGGPKAAGQKAAAMRENVLAAVSDLLEQQVPLVVLLGAVPGAPDLPDEEDPVRHPLAVMDEAATHLVAPSPTDEQLRELVARIWVMYRAAYPENAVRFAAEGDDEWINLLLRRYRRHPAPVPRHLVRLVIEVLDAVDTGAMSDFTAIAGVMDWDYSRAL